MTPEQAEAVVAKIRDPNVREQSPSVTTADWHRLYMQLQGTILAQGKDIDFLQSLLRERDACIRQLAEQNDEMLEALEGMTAKEEHDDGPATDVPPKREHGRDPKRRRGTNGGHETAKANQGTDTGKASRQN